MRNLSSFGQSGQLASERDAVEVAIDRLIAERLVHVEALFSEQLASPVAIVAEIGSFVAGSGGKRVRPTTHLLAARLCGYSGPHDVLLATVLEFIHSATLIHDDIIDEAQVRRGRPSVNSNWGNNVTVLFGDYLFAKAMELALRAESLEVMQRLADVTLRMTEGEMLQTRYAGRLDLSVDEYLDLIDRKTAALFGCCCELAAILAYGSGGAGGGEGAEKRRALRDYGRNLGMAFQLVDDLLDFTGNVATLGKPAATDLSEGKTTLAVIDLLQNGPAEAHDVVSAVVRGTSPQPELLSRLGQLLADSGALARTRERARRYAERAGQALEIFDDGPARRAMLTLPELLLERDR